MTKSRFFAAAWTLVVVESMAVPGSVSAQAVVVGAGFAGISDPAAGVPDPMIAVGPNHVVQTVNHRIAFFDKSGTLLSNQWLGAGGLFSSVTANPAPYDPKCLYDQHSGRFVVVALNGPLSLLLGISDDGDPNGTWHQYMLDATTNIGGIAYGADYPSLAADSAAIYVSWDVPNIFGTILGVKYRVFNKTPVLSGLPAVYTDWFSPTTFSAQFAHVFGVSPAVYAVSVAAPGSILIQAMTNPLGAATLAAAIVPVPAFATPPLMGAPQPGTAQGLSVLDGRFINAVWRNGSLWCGHGVQIGGKTVARWYEFHTNGWPLAGTPTLFQSGQIDPGLNAGQPVHTWFPTIMANACNQAALVFARSAATEYAGVWATGRLATDPPGTMMALAALQVGSTAYLMYRWGDYFGIALDPSDQSTFWCVGEVPISAQGYGTWIGSFNLGGGASTISYGLGWPGTGGVVPALTVSANPSIGSTVVLQLGNTAGVATAGAVLFGSAPAAVPTALGGTLLATSPLAIVEVVLAPGLNSYPIFVPNDPALCGQSLYLQGGLSDAGASHGVAFTAGLRAVFGP